MGICSQLCRVVIWLFIFCYTVVGLAFLVVGVWLKARNISEISLTNGENALIAVGVLMLITGIVGDYGSCFKKTPPLAIFGVLLVILIAAQIALYVQRDNVGPRVAEFYLALYAIYIASGDIIVGGTLRVMHYTLNCCGILGINGLDPISHTCPEKSGFDRFMSACPTVLMDVYGANPPMAMGIFYGNAVLMILCLLCSVALGRMLQVAAPPRYVHLTQSVLSLSSPLAPPHLHPHLHPADGGLDVVVLTSMAPGSLAEA